MIDVHRSVFEHIKLDSHPDPFFQPLPLLPSILQLQISCRDISDQSEDERQLVANITSILADPLCNYASIPSLYHTQNTTDNAHREGSSCAFKVSRCA